MENFKLSTQKIILIVSAGIGFIAAFLPWGTIGGFTAYSGLYGLAWLSFMIYGAVIALCFVEEFVPQVKDFIQNTLKDNYKFVIMGAGGLCALIAFIYVVSPVAFCSMGFGAILSLLAGGAVAANPFLDKFLGGGPKE